MTQEPARHAQPIPLLSEMSSATVERTTPSYAPDQKIAVFYPREVARVLVQTFPGEYAFNFSTGMATESIPSC
jgi:hypothetical protein